MFQWTCTINRAGKISGNTVKFLNEDLLKQIQRRLLHGPQQIVGSTYIMQVLMFGREVGGGGANVRPRRGGGGGGGAGSGVWTRGSMIA